MKITKYFSKSKIPKVNFESIKKIKYFFEKYIHNFKLTFNKKNEF